MAHDFANVHRPVHSPKSIEPPRRGRGRRGLVIRSVAFVALAAATIGAGVYLVRPRAAPTLAADERVTVTMAGFAPRTLSVPAQQRTAVQLNNPDSPYHSDGGGMHQFAIPELGIDVKVDPRSSVVFGLPPLDPGTYTFFCDVCCGGKENPAMQGKLVVS